MRRSIRQNSQPFPSSPQAPPPSGGVLWCYGGPRVSLVPTAYCVKCKAPREIVDPERITMKNGRPATGGTCPVCGTRIFKIGAPDAPERGEPPSEPGEAAGR